MLFGLLMTLLLPLCHGHDPREDFVDAVNQHRVDNGKAALQISRAMMDVGSEHMANYEWAQTYNLYSWDGNCSAPRSWYDDGMDHDWKPCCHSQDSTCTQVKAIQVTCGEENQFYYSISPAALSVYGTSTFQERMDDYTTRFSSFILSDSWKSFGCDFSTNISPAIYICYFSSKEDANTYIGSL